MTSEDERRSRDPGREAAERYVDIDANGGDLEREKALVEWLERAPDHEAAYERCEAAVVIAQELAARGELAVLRAGGAVAATADGAAGAAFGAAPPRAAHGFGGRFPRRAGPVVAWLGRPAVAWTVAAAAVLWAVAASVEPDTSGGGVADDAARTVADGDDGASGARVGDDDIAVASRPAKDTETDPAHAADDELRAAGDAASAATMAAADVPPAALVAWNPVAVLPGDIIVDVHSVAVLPFDPSAERSAAEAGSANADERAAAERIARQLHDEVMRQLARIPGLYVVDARASIAHDDAGLEPDQIAALLSVRGVVAADVEVDDRTVRVQLRMTDAVNAGRRTETRFERPIDELPAVRTAIVANITDALASTTY